jgi:hypothetical protein
MCTTDSAERNSKLDAQQQLWIKLISAHVFKANKVLVVVVHGAILLL